MIIKFFHQGQKQADYIVEYLLSEDRHNGIKPEVIEGSPSITKEITHSLNLKNKYTTGVVSFKQGEQLTRQQMHELINQFQKSFCPFDDEARVNFLWVLHTDKGRQELHFVSPRACFLHDGSMKSFNMHPPGKANLLFYESFVRLQNVKYGFEQVDKKEMTAQDVRFYKDTFTDLFEKRKKYLYSCYDRPKTIKTKGMKNGRTRTSGPKAGSSQFNRKYTQFRNCANGVKFKIESCRSLQQSVGSKPNRNEGSFLKHGSAAQSAESFAKYARNAVETAARLSGGIGVSATKERGSKPSGATPKPFLSVEDEILALAIQLNHCEPWEAPAITARLNFLQGYKETLVGEKPKASNTKFKPQ